MHCELAAAAGHRMGFPGTMISCSDGPRESHGAACNRVPLLSKRRLASSRVVAGACAAACPDLTCRYSKTLRKTTNGLEHSDPRRDLHRARDQRVSAG